MSDDGDDDIMTIFVTTVIVILPNPDEAEDGATGKDLLHSLRRKICQLPAIQLKLAGKT